MNKPYQRELGQVAQNQWLIKLTVNGVDRMIWCDPAARLSDILRDRLGLTGTKVGCNAGDCGACTVLLDARQVCACLTSVAQAEGRVVETVEGLGEGGQLSDLQQAFLAHGAAQCGICTPGMLMAASDLLARHPNPTKQEVLGGLGGVLCRCTGYQKIVEAVLAASQGHVHAADAPAGQAVGSRQAKLNGVPKVTGVKKYGADQAPRAALWLRVIRSPHQRATFTLGDFSVLKEKYPGLVDVMSAADVPENSFGIFPDVKDQPVLANGQVRFCGEAVIGLVGEYEAVMAIAEAELPIAWHPEAPVTESEAALNPRANRVHASAPENILCRGRVVKGDVDQALSDAPFVAEGEFQTSYIEHAYIEPEAGYAERFVENGVDRIRIFACTQTPYMDRDEVARVLKIKPEQVHIVPSAIGGGFGGKLDIALQPLIAVAAWKLGQPVKCAYSRPESMRSTPKRHPGKMRALCLQSRGQADRCRFPRRFQYRRLRILGQYRRHAGADPCLWSVRCS
jgi:aerobic-type carbon monoxide dehydrogenase small subunit (CoxS/CutS family)